MRSFIMICLSVIAFFAVSAHANTTKLGNVIAVEKEIENVYAECLKTFKETPKQEAQSYICVIPVTDKTTDTILNKGRVLNYKTKTCLVDAEAGPKSILLYFGSATTAVSFAEATACLSEAIAKSDAVKVIMYTIE